MSFHGLPRRTESTSDGIESGLMATSANPMNFTENQQGNVVLEKLRQQRESGRFCDVVLVVQGKQFPAHRNILAACSPYFDSILRMHKVVKELVTVACQSADVFELLLNYMYSGNVVIDRRNVTELLKLAHNFLVSKLKNYCAEYLDRYLDARNCLAVKELADKYNMPALAKNAAHFLEANVNGVLVDSSDLLEYPLSRAETMLSDETFPNASLEAQLRFIARYVLHRPEEREEHLAGLLSLTRWNTRGTQQDSTWSDWVEQQPLFRDKPSSLLILLHYARENGLRGLCDTCERMYRAMRTEESGDVGIYLNNGDEQANTSIHVKQEPPETPPLQQPVTPLRIKLRLNERCSAEGLKLKRVVVESESRVNGGVEGCESMNDGQAQLDSCDGNSSADDDASSSANEDDEECRTDGTKAELLFKCPHCIYTSGSQPRIQCHISKAHSRDRTFMCAVCSFECKWNRQYYTHMKEHFQGPPFACDSCEYTADRIQMLLTHRMKHTDERPFQCKQCDYRCRTKTNLAAHMRSHTGEKPFTCPSCFRCFAIKSTLDQHLATHSDARPFVCDQCEFSTKYQSHLISHKRIHTGDVFRCQYPQCSYSSPKKSQLAAHMRTHMAVRTHQCKQCGRSFIEKSHLVRHERIHLQVKPFKCDQCSYASSRRDKLKEHVQKHHVLGVESSDRYRSQISGGRRKEGGRMGKRCGRAGRPSFVLGVDAVRHRRLSSGCGGGRLSGALTSGRPHSSMGFRPITPHTLAPEVAAGSMVDLNALLGAYQPSPFEGAALQDGDVLLSTHAPGLLMSDSPQSTTNSLLSDPFPSAATPIGDSLQRPMSLPPLGAQAAITTDFNFFE